MKSSKELGRFQSRMKRYPTKHEADCFDLLVRNGFRPKMQMILGFYIADVVLEEQMLILEIDGASHKNNQEYDAMRDKFLRNIGFKVVHILNQDVDTFDFEGIHKMPRFKEWVVKQARSKANVFRSLAISGLKARKRIEITYEEHLENPDATCL